MIRGDEEFQRKLAGSLTGLTSRDLATVRKAREARDNVRIEELAEALENLAVAISATARTKGDNQPQSPIVTEYLANSRQWLREALRDFMTPNLHLVNGQARQTDINTPPDEQVRCERCHETSMCRNLLCADWAAAIKKHLSAGEEDFPPEDDYPRAA